METVSGFNSIYALPACLVGILVGLTGVGGGSLMTPLLVLMFGVHPATAVGTDLLQASITKSVGTVVHGMSDTVEWKIVRRLALGSLPAAAVTIFVLSFFGLHGDAASRVISSILGVALVLTAIATLFRRQVIAFFNARFGEVPEDRNPGFTVVLGAVIGALVSLTSVGAGAIGVTALILLYPKLPLSRIVGSDIAHAVPLTLLAGLGHLYLGTIDWGLLGSLLLGSIPGIIIGSLIASRVPELLLRPALATTLLLVGTKLVY
jgi:uncharacterized membrane protein YfcA